MSTVYTRYDAPSLRDNCLLVTTPDGARSYENCEAEAVAGLPRSFLWGPVGWMPKAFRSTERKRNP